MKMGLWCRGALWPRFLLGVECVVGLGQLPPFNLAAVCYYVGIGLAMRRGVKPVRAERRASPGA